MKFLADQGGLRSSWSRWSLISLEEREDNERGPHVMWRLPFLTLEAVLPLRPYLTRGVCTGSKLFR
jgi:hypothetical protein